MKDEEKSKLIQGLKKRLSVIESQKHVRIETAFVHWYVNTRFEENCDNKITDGQDDGGIDAVIFAGKTIYVIQSKFCHDIFKKEYRLFHPKNIANLMA
jgi:hypothetical protein